jgi:predicted ATPase
LVTSQVPLKLPQERLYRLGPLDVPDHDVSADEALSYGAVALFSERAQSADRHFRLTDDNAGAVIALCRQLDGSALAIELAAARVALLGLHQLTESLDQRLSLLTKGNRSAPRRQQTLRAALEWSHDGLSAAERVVFRRLAVTVDSATLELIQEVAADDSIDRWQVLDALDALVERSLVAVVPGEPPRYRLLESPRALALERLAASGEGEALRQRHARALSALLVAAKTRAPGLPSDRVLADLEPDLGNARAALGWALRHDPAAAVGLAPGMAIMLGQHRYDEQMAMWRATEACLSDEPTPALRASWARSAAGFWVNRHPKEGRDWARHAVSLYRDLGDAMGLYLSLCVLAQSRLADAGDEPREALNELRRLERPDWPAGVRFFGTQADLFVTYYSEDWTGAEAAVRKALALGELGGNSSSSLVARTNLVDLTLIRGDAPEAVRLGHALVQDLLASRWVNHVNFARVNLAKALLACDDVAQARATALAAWPTASRYDLQLFWLDVLTLLAALEGRWHTAARLHGFAALGYAENQEKRRVGEAQAAMRAEQLTRATLGDETFERLSVEGRGMNGAQIGDIALDRADSLGEARARVPPAAAPPRTD